MKTVQSFPKIDLQGFRSHSPICRLQAKIGGEQGAQYVKYCKLSLGIDCREYGLHLNSNFTLGYCVVVRLTNSEEEHFFGNIPRTREQPPWSG